MFAEIDDAEAWPTWWPNVRAVERFETAGPGKVGARFRTTFVGKLPYELRFDLRVSDRQPLTSIVGVATGELEGTGEWTLWTEEDWTVVRYVWSILTTARWMNLLAPLPFVDGIFRSTTMR